MRDLFAGLSSQLVEMVIYSAIAVVFLTGLFKCILPYRHAAGLFRRGIRGLQLLKNQDDGRPAWQDPLFLGKSLQIHWGRFLRNAEQLDARGLSCDTRDYINHDDIFVSYAHLQLADMIPGLLTSLGILGTFIGLMRGLGNLDISTADSTMRGISQMIGGMTFAYGTSIAGVASSLLFNILFRAAQGSALGAMDDYNQSFSDLVMQQPLDDSVYHKVHLEDQAAFLSRSAGELSQSLSGGIEAAIGRAFVPISQSMSNFILSEAQGQIEGLNHIVNQFVIQMNNALGGQFERLARTLSSINQQQTMSLDSVNQSLEAADSIMRGIENTHKLSQAVIDRFEGYVRELSLSQQGTAQLAESMGGMLGAMHQNLERQSDSFSQLRASQSDMAAQMQQYAAWSGRVLEAVEKQSDAAMERSHEVANQMAASSKALSGSYASFVEGISTGLARTMGMFEENMHDMMQGLAKQLGAIGRDQAKGDQVVDLGSVSRLQQAMADMTSALNRTVVAIQQMAEGA